MEKIKTLMSDKARMREIILYLVFGVLTTVVNLAVYGGLVLLIPSQRILAQQILFIPTHLYWYQVASVIAWLAAVAFAYAGNKIFVFKSRHLSRWELVMEATSFFGARALSLLLFDLAGLSLCVQVFHMGDFTAKLLMNVLVVVFNYVASKLVIFRKKEPNA
jgi:putative flippase GtrA